MVASNRPVNWKHDKTSFFKYTSRQAAIAILRNRSLRWSSPSAFNDPFDMQFDMSVELDDVPRIKRLTLKSLWDTHYSQVEIDDANALGRLIKSVRGIFPKFTRRQFNKEFGSAIDESLRRLPNLVSVLNKNFKKSMEDVKVLCLSDRNDSILMWSHYSEFHQGVVLEFGCVPEVDSTWGAALPVRYDTMPRMFDNDFIIRLGSGQVSMASKSEIDKLVTKFVTAKAKDWSYEQEWRVVLHFTDPNQITQDIKFTTKEYFGCQMPNDDRVTVAKLVNTLYPQAKILMARKKLHEFGIEFFDYEPLQL